MAKKTTNKAAKAAPQKKATTEPKVPTTPPTEEPQILEPETVVEPTAQQKVSLSNTTLGDLVTGKAQANLDANHRVDLNGQVIDVFIKNPNARNQFGDQVVDGMTHIAAVGVISAVMDEVTNGNSTFALTIKKQHYETLAEVGKTMGLTLPPLTKTLPGSVEGTVQLPSEGMKVSAEAKKQLKEEKKVEEAGDKEEIELDPEKIAHMSEDDLRKALTYILIVGPKRDKSVKATLVNAVDFMHKYRIELARQAENSTEAMNRMEDRSMYEWLNDIFSYVKPTTYLNGIGIGMHSLISQEKSPLSAFIALRGQMYKKTNGVADKDENGNFVMEWDDQSIADAVRATVELKCRDNIAASEEKKAALDKKAKGYRKEAEVFDKAIADERAVLGYLSNISFDIADKYSESADNDVYQKAYGRILKMYYPKYEHRGSNYRNLNENIQQRAGIILNLFKSPDNANQVYAETNLLPIEEIPLEEVAKAKLEAKKTEEAKAEAKKN